MRAGVLRHRIAFRAISEKNKDATGAIMEVPVVVAWRWASIEPIRGREYFLVSVSERFADMTHRIRCRFLASVTPKMDILFGTREFDILQAVNVEERGRELEIMARERL